MESAMAWIADNKILTALATIGGILALAILIITAARRAYGWILSRSNKRYTAARSRNMKDATIGATKPSYLISVMAEHFLFLIGFTWFFYLFNGMSESLLSLKSQSLIYLHISLALSKWLLGFLIGDRAADIMIVAGHVKRICIGNDQ